MDVSFCVFLSLVRLLRVFLQASFEEKKNEQTQNNNFRCLLLDVKSIDEKMADASSLSPTVPDTSAAILCQ